MAKVIFKYSGIETLIQCKIEDKLKDICERYVIKIQKDINKLIFIYGGITLNLDLQLKEVINKMDRQDLKMNILVYDTNSNIIDERVIQSKDVICPKCGEICLIEFKDYKVRLNNCKNNHESIISLNEYEETQNINENKIICGICNQNDKSKSYNNRFYICGICNKNICLLCKENHNKDHKIIDYENKNYICNKHNDSLISYCEICKENLCMQCQMMHDKNHRFISYMDIFPNINNIRKKIEELKDIINKFNKDIDNIINRIKNIKMNVEKYYIINNNILNNYDIQKRNYESFKNLNNMNNIINNIIVDDIKDIIKEEDINNKFKKIYNLEEKMRNKKEKKNELDEIKDLKEKKEKIICRNEINIKYKTEEKGEQNIFGSTFVENNGNKIELIINGTKSKLIDKYNLEKGENNIKLIIKDNLTNLSSMFYECKSLYNIDELKYLDVSKCTDFSSMFSDCSSLSDIKSLEKQDVSKCTDFSSMFDCCYSLSDIKPLEKWDISKCTNFGYTFDYCSKLIDKELINKKFK